MASAIALDSAIYSNSVMDKATDLCFLLAHVINALSRKKQ